MTLDAAVPDLEYIGRLPGKKVIIRGNHDYWWNTRSKIDKFLAANGFDTISIMHNCGYRVGDRAICGTRGWLYNSETEEDRKIVSREAGRLLTSMAEAKALGGQLTAFLHYPPLYGGMECREILDILVENEVSDCYFGHIHGQYAAQKALTGSYKGVKMHLISCDYVNFKPVKVEDAAG